MKNLKKIIVAASLCAAIGATAIAGTLAYFTSETQVETNTFTAGDLEITLDEPVWDAEVGEGAFEIIPGNSVVKDPTVTLENGSVDSYVRMVVTMPKDVYEMSNLATGSGDAIVLFYDDETLLSPVSIANENVEAGTVDLYFDTVMSAGEKYRPFTKIAFSGEQITNDKADGEYNAIYRALDDLTIDVQAYAVQYYSFEDEGVDYAMATAFPKAFGTVTGE